MSAMLMAPALPDEPDHTVSRPIEAVSEARAIEELIRQTQEPRNVRTRSVRDGGRERSDDRVSGTW